MTNQAKSNRSWLTHGEAIIGAVVGAVLTVGLTVIYNYYIEQADKRPAVFKYHVERDPTLVGSSLDGSAISPKILIGENIYDDVTAIKIRLFNTTGTDYKDLKVSLNIRSPEKLSNLIVDPEPYGVMQQTSQIETTTDRMNGDSTRELCYTIKYAPAGDSPVFAVTYLFKGNDDYKVELGMCTPGTRAELVSLRDLTVDVNREREYWGVPFRMVIFGMGLGFVIAVIGLLVVRKVSNMAAEINETEIEAVITGAYAALGSNPSHYVLDASIANLRKILERNPTNRRASILLGRLHRRRNSLSQAIDVLSSTITARTAKGLDSGQDTADLLYNRACYRTLLAEQHQHDEDNYTALKRQALEDISNSISLWPTNREDAMRDGDLQLIRNDMEKLLDPPETPKAKAD